MKISHKGLTLLKDFEGLRLTAYRCIAGRPTIGFGTTKGVTQADVDNRRTITQLEAERMLNDDLLEYERGVLAACTRVPNQNQFAAFVCFAYNVGVAGFRSSTALKAHNRGDDVAAARAMGLWNKATLNGKKQVLAGLTRRRAAEAALYLEPPYSRALVADMPQAVDPESKMTSSPINRASVVAGGAASIAALNESLYAVRELKAGAADLGDWLVPVLLIAVVGLCGFVVWERLRQRAGGWA